MKKSNGLSERDEIIFKFAFNAGAYWECDYDDCTVLDQLKDECAKAAKKGGKG